MGMWGEYVPVAVRKEQAKKKLNEILKKGLTAQPVHINGRLIAKEFWGKKWCEHLENFADYENRLPRGRTYARNGSVCHLSIEDRAFEAYVSGSSLYHISGEFTPIDPSRWEKIKQTCQGQISSLLELLQGKISTHIMHLVADENNGLFPQEKEMSYECSCPDWAGMCKHVAAVLYGIGHRLDQQPALLFKLRGVDASELITTEMNLEAEIVVDQLEMDGLGDLFGIDLETSAISIKEEKESVLKNDSPLRGEILSQFQNLSV
jgi:uncharacterized Zn finger protein